MPVLSSFAVFREQLGLAQQHDCFADTLLGLAQQHDCFADTFELSTGITRGPRQAFEVDEVAGILEHESDLLTLLPS